jgi:Bacterial nucleoid DNA-binding protein
MGLADLSVFEKMGIAGVAVAILFFGYKSLQLFITQWKASTDALADGDKVQLVGFGNFETAERSARKGRNPQTGEEVNIPATVVPKFKPGSKLRNAVK